MPENEKSNEEVEKFIEKMKEVLAKRVARFTEDYDKSMKERKADDARILKAASEIFIAIAAKETEVDAFIEEAAKRGVDGVWAAYMLGAYGACHRHMIRSRGDMIITNAMESTEYDKLRAVAREKVDFEQFEKKARERRAETPPGMTVDAPPLNEGKAAPKMFQ